MNTFLVYLQEVSSKHKKLIGNKALALAKIMREDINVCSSKNHLNKKC